MKLYLLLTLVTFFLQTRLLHAQSQSNVEECSKQIDLLNEKQKNQESAILSLNSLINSGKDTELNLASLFQIDLTDKDSVREKLNELESETKQDSAQGLLEFEGLRKCKNAEELYRLMRVSLDKQKQLNLLKLNFLKLEQNKRESLISAYQDLRKQKIEQSQIDQQLLDSKEIIKDAQEIIIKSEVINKTSQSEGLTLALTLLEQFSIDIEKEHIAFIDLIKEERKKLESLRGQINEYLQKTDSPSVKFTQIDNVWRETADSLISTFSKITLSSQHELPNEFKGSVTESEATLYEKYKKSFKKTKKRFLDLKEQKKTLFFDLEAQNFRLLNDAGQLRSEQVIECTIQKTCSGVGELNEKTITGIVKELRILPLKFLTGALNTLVELKSKVSGGIDGWTDIVRQSLIFIFLILLPTIAHKFLNWISRKLDEVRDRILARSMIDYKKRTQAAYWISRLNPFLPSLGMILSIHVARSLIESTDFNILSNVLFYLEIFFFYKATRLLMKLAFEMIFSTASITHSSMINQRSESSARRLSRYFFFQYFILHLVEDTVRRSLVYHIAHEILLWISIVIVLKELITWKDEIIGSFLSRFSNLWAKASFQSSSKTIYLLLPLFFVAIIAHDLTQLLSQKLIRFDFFKKIISDVFRKKLEKNSIHSDDLKSPNKDYLSFFDYYLPAKPEFYVDRDPIMAKKIISSIQAWFEEKSLEDLALLVGNRGIGKTTSLKMISESFKDHSKIMCRIEPKVVDANGVYIWLSNVLKSEIRSVEDFIRYESKLKQKTLIIIDDIHNLFLGKIGGFEAYHLFMDIIGYRSKNIFWCLSANSHAWSYLKGVFGKEHFYGKVYQMRMWSDSEIQNLILSRHDMTGFKRIFDQSIAAYGTGNVLGDQVETQFFRLLWGQSRGNPRSALMYWISAASQVSEKEIYVGVPKFIDSAIVGSMSNKALMVLAALAKHDSLTMDEIFDVTSIDKLTIRKVIKESIENGLIWEDEKHRIRISSRAQNAVDYYLIGKNFLYE